MPSTLGSSILPAPAATETVPLTTCHGPRTERRNRAGDVTLHHRQPCVEKLGVDVLFVVAQVTSATLSILTFNTTICRFTTIKEVRGQVYQEPRAVSNPATHHNHYFNIV